MWRNFLEGGPASRQEGTEWRKKVAAAEIVGKGNPRKNVAAGGRGGLQQKTSKREKEGGEF